jgi:predicted transcriptional regulator
VLKTMQIMFEKGLVKRDERQKAHLYRSALPAPRVQKRLVDDLVERAFGGAADQLVMHALAARTPTAEEIARLRGLLATLEANHR